MRMIGGLDAIALFEQMYSLLPEQEQSNLSEEYGHAMNRIKYEVAKGIGKRKRKIPAAKSWHHDTYVCGKCGCGADEAWHKYCPNCGTAYRKEPRGEYMQKKEELYKQIGIDDWIDAFSEHPESNDVANT